ncbi:sigma-70 family RNA polymerase sigma factor [Candidatus Woesearchaeota archaeon]|nr:sigma-70 family RNA polymerase sigma factor [Candidatus Woesearchaeota archaeon]
MTEVMTEIKTEVKPQQKWEYFNQLGLEYHLIQQETGLGTSPENRSSRQQQIVQEVVGGTMRYFYWIAHRALRGGYFRNEKGEKKELTVRGNHISLIGTDPRMIDDLVQEAALRVNERFHQYDPEKGPISVFLKEWALGYTKSYADRNQGIVRSPTRSFTLKLSRQFRFKSRNGFIQRFEAYEEKRKDKRGVSPFWVAAAAYLSLGKEYQNLWTLPKEKFLRKGPCISYESEYLADEETPSPEETVMKQELVKKVQEALNTLSDREKLVIQRRFLDERGEKNEPGSPNSLQAIGNDLGISHEQVRQNGASALKKMRELVYLQELFFP